MFVYLKFVERVQAKLSTGKYDLIGLRKVNTFMLFFHKLEVFKDERE